MYSVNIHMHSVKDGNVKSIVVKILNYYYFNKLTTICQNYGFYKFDQPKYVSLLRLKM